MTAPATPRLMIWGIEGLPEVEAGEDLGRLIATTIGDLQDGDVVVVTSKVVSKAEGRLVPGSRDDHLASETMRVVATRGETQIVQTRHGLVLAAAGIDASNVPRGTVALLPIDPDASALAIRATVLAERGIDIAVIVSDTMGRPWRDGVIDAAIGAAGLDVLWDLRGQHDPAGHLLEATVIAVGDELASAADLVKGKLTSTPVAVIRGFPFSRNVSERGARPLIRPSSDDMFRLGTREAKRLAIAESEPVPAGGGASYDDQPEAVRRAIESLGIAADTLAVDEAGTTVTATGEPLDIGVTLGRLLVALAGEDLRATQPVPLPDSSGATVTVRAAVRNESHQQR
jgi:coenzyme F420-0:L-glutamate ligase / coenzyme F420-1:gamma-L-glutamate ligase